MDENKMLVSVSRLKEAARKIFERDPEFTGQLNLEIHCKDGIVRDVYEVKSRRKV